MAKFRVEIRGMDQLKENLKELPFQIRAEVDAEIEDTMKTLRAGALRDAPADEATLRQGIQYERLNPMDYQLNSSAYHSPFLEFGTKRRFKPIPGVDASRFKPIGKKSGKGFYDSILDWVKRKKIAGTYSVKTRKRTGSKVNQQIEDEQTAFAIYLSILRHGIHPQPFFFKQLTPAIEARLLSRIKNVIGSLKL